MTQELAMESYSEFLTNKENSPETYSGETTIEMYCFCQKNIITNLFNSIQFSDGATHCNDWFANYVYLIILQLVPSLCVQVLSVISTFLFIYLAKQENNKTLTVQNQRIFLLIFMQQFISVAIV